MEHVYIEPRTPQRNGKVERSHRSDENELYPRLTCKDDVDLEEKLAVWARFNKNDRPHGAHKGKTPYEVLREKRSARPTAGAIRNITTTTPCTVGSRRCGDWDQAKLRDFKHLGMESCVLASRLLPEAQKDPAHQIGARALMWQVSPMQNLDFRAPGRVKSASELVRRAWPQATPRQREAAFAAGEVRVAGEIQRTPMMRVPPGSRIQVTAREGQQKPAPTEVQILQRGRDFCIVDKPRGWPSHQATPEGLDARQLVAATIGLTIETLWPVHRLDADVGGAWLIALSKEAASRLSTVLAQSDVEKEYRAIVPRLPWRSGRFLAGIDGKQAETIFQVITSEHEEGDTCEVSLKLVTGRTHQLRRHLAGARCAIIGDPLYGGIVTEGDLRLYSRSITIASEGIEAVAPEPPGFQVSEAIYAETDRTSEVLVSHATAIALARGHPWILSDTETSDVGGMRPGSLAIARSVRGKRVCECRIEGPGRIAARLWTQGGKTKPCNASIAERVASALGRRAELIQSRLDKRATTSFRLVHGEADGLPGLMVDRVGDELRVLSMWRGSRAFERETIDSLIDALGDNLGVVMVRHFAERPKGQFLSTFVYDGTPSDKPFVVKERGLSFEVDTGLGEPLRSRPGFGLYIDQRENRESVANQVRSTGGGRWLNLFCHTGAFSVAALAAGADEVTSVDLSKPYLMTLERNLELNSIDSSRHTAVKMDVRRYVEKWQKNDRFDGIILDPPTASAAGKKFWSARKGQALLVEECLKHLSPRGVILVCRNDHGAKESLRHLVNRASQKAGVKLQGMIEAGPGADFPSVRAFREGEAFEGVLATRK